MIVEDSGRSIAIRLGDMIVAEHDVSTKPGLEIAHPEHVKAMWSLTMALAQRRTPVPSWRLTFQDHVETRPLSAYEAAL